MNFETKTVNYVNETSLGKIINEWKADNNSVKDRIEKDGIGHAIQHGLAAKEIEDKKLADLWKKGAKALSDIEKYLK